MSDWYHFDVAIYKLFSSLTNTAKTTKMWFFAAFDAFIYRFDWKFVRTIIYIFGYISLKYYCRLLVSMVSINLNNESVVDNAICSLTYFLLKTYPTFRYDTCSIDKHKLAINSKAFVLSVLCRKQGKIAIVQHWESFSVFRTSLIKKSKNRVIQKLREKMSSLVDNFFMNKLMSKKTLKWLGEGLFSPLPYAYKC